MGLWEQGFAAFATDERDFNDGAQDCGASLTVTGGVAAGTYHGMTGKDQGHAEIHALCQFLNAIGWDTGAFAGYALTVSCTAKPCCKFCSAVMGLFGIAAGEGTYKSQKTSRGTSYSRPPKVRTFLKKYLGVSEQRVMEELSN